MTKPAPSADFPYASQYVEVLGSRMHYVKEGQGDPILFLHGIPTSSYVWRNVIPHLARLGTCIAPDLIGFGKSDKPNINYSISDHIKYIEAFIEALKLNRITLIMHGWGSLIGFDYAMRHEKKCKGLVFYEAYLRPPQEDDISLPYQEQMLSWQERENLEELMTHGNVFIDNALAQGTMRSLGPKEMDYYREPFKEAGTSKPLYQYLKELPKKEGVANQLIAHYSQKLTQSVLPKLMLYSIPGFITTIATLMWAKENLPNLEVVEIGEELHYAQESYPDLIGETISVWLQGIEQNK